MSKRIKHNALSSYTSLEADNISLGQGGFNILKGIPTANGLEHIAGPGTNSVATRYYPDVEFWVSIKAIRRALVGNSSVIAESMQGDDLMLRQTGYTSTGDTLNVDLKEDDVINGCFTKIRICNAISHIQALKG